MKKKIPTPIFASTRVSAQHLALHTHKHKQSDCSGWHSPMLAYPSLTSLFSLIRNSPGAHLGRKKNSFIHRSFLWSFDCLCGKVLKNQEFLLRCLLAICTVWIVGRVGVFGVVLGKRKAVFPRSYKQGVSCSKTFRFKNLGKSSIFLPAFGRRGLKNWHWFWGGAHVSQRITLFWKKSTITCICLICVWFVGFFQGELQKGLLSSPQKKHKNVQKLTSFPNLHVENAYLD